MKMELSAYIANERTPIGALYVLRKGMVVRLWRFLGANSVWGEDILLESDDLMCHAQAVALTYIEVVSLTKDNFEEVAVNFPGPMALVRRIMRKVTVQRMVMRGLSRMAGHKGARSFIARDLASGYNYSTNAVSLEKRMEQLLLPIQTQLSEGAAGIERRDSAEQSKGIAAKMAMDKASIHYT